MARTEKESIRSNIYGLTSLFIGDQEKREIFEGPDGLRDATAYFEQSVLNESSLEVWLDRTSGPNGSVFIRRVGRNPISGLLEDMPFAAALVQDPTDPD